MFTSVHGLGSRTKELCWEAGTGVLKLWICKVGPVNEGSAGRSFNIWAPTWGSETLRVMWVEAALSKYLRNGSSPRIYYLRSQKQEGEVSQRAGLPFSPDHELTGQQALIIHKAVRVGSLTCPRCTLLFIYWLLIFLERMEERGREREKHRWESETPISAASGMPPARDRAWNPGTCPNGESNLQPLGAWEDTQPSSHTSQD